MDFKEIISEFCDSSNIGIYMIHLDRAIERKPLISALEKKLQTEPIIFNAVNGSELVANGHPIKSACNPDIHTRSPGEIGCTVSHVNVCRDALSKKYNYIVVFEDDVVFNSSLKELDKSLNNFNNLRLPWDIFFLDCDPIINKERVGGSTYCKVQNFNNAHAYIINMSMMETVVKYYETYFNNNVVQCADGIYSDILTQTNMRGYGFNVSSQHFKQYRQGLYSYITESIR